MDSATKRWVKNAADEYAVSQGCFFDEAKAKHVEDFFRIFLRHSKGEWAGKPFELLDWQREDLVYPLFGWQRPDGTRRFRRSFVFLPKKQGKSTIASGLGLYMLCGDGEPGSEVYSAANDQQQASIVHGEAINMVEASPELSALLKINFSNKNIIYPGTRSYYRALSSSPAGSEGLNAHAVVIDELHAWRGDKLWNSLKYAFRARRQGLIFVITTAGDDETSVCYQQYEYAKQVLSGDVKDDRFFSFVCEASKDDDWTQEETWHKANPSLGQTVRLDDFAADVSEARNAPASVQSAFKRYSLNIWTSSTNAMLKPEDWASCKRDFTEQDLHGEPCWGGLDLSKSRDMTAFSLTFKTTFEEDTENNEYKVLTWYWLPEDVATHKDAPSYIRDWVDRGFIYLTPGNVCDYNFVINSIVSISQRFSIQHFAYDPWNAESTTQALADTHGIKRVSFSQTASNYAEPTAEFERLVLSGRLHHNDNPVLNWQARNVVAKTDVNGNRRPVKPTFEDPRKIDGVVATIMALSQAMTANYRPSIYETRGILAV